MNTPNTAATASTAEELLTLAEGVDRIASGALSEYDGSFKDECLLHRASLSLRELAVLKQRAGADAGGVTEGVQLIANERRRQIEVEGFSAEHDDSYGDFPMAEAAVCYAQHVADRGWLDPEGIAEYRSDEVISPEVQGRGMYGWPKHWDKAWWKPHSILRDLVKAGALIAAEIDRAIRNQSAVAPLMRSPVVHSHTTPSNCDVTQVDVTLLAQPAASVPKEVQPHADRQIFTDRLVTDSLGFELRVNIEVGNFQFRGCHSTYENAETGNVDAGAEHHIQISRGMPIEERAEVVSHECYHLFYSVKHLIKVDEETEVEVFGQLNKHLFSLVERDAHPPQAAEPAAVGEPWAEVFDAEIARLDSNLKTIDHSKAPNAEAYRLGAHDALVAAKHRALKSHPPQPVAAPAVAGGDAVNDLAVMLRRMIWQARKQNGDTSIKALAGNAHQLLCKYRLEGSPLRDEAASPQAQAQPVGVRELIAKWRDAAVQFNENGYVGFIFDNCARELEQALSSIPPNEQGAKVPDGWQPIETAPKDDKVCLMGWGESRYRDGYGPIIMRWFNNAGDLAKGFWTCNAIQYYPTHWMPLPAAPSPVPTAAAKPDEVHEVLRDAKRYLWWREHADWIHDNGGITGCAFSCQINVLAGHSKAVLFDIVADHNLQQAVPDAVVDDGFVKVHKDVVLFLTGRGSIKGHWFGDAVNGKQYWWRSMLPYVAQQPPSPEEAKP